MNRTIQINLGIWLTLAFGSMSLGQDPFGETVPEPMNNAFAGDTAPKPAEPTPSGIARQNADELPPANHPIVRTLRERPPKTAREWARAILYLVRLQELEELERYVAKWKSSPLTPTIANEMLAEIGLDSWISIRANPSLSETTKNWFDQIVQLSLTGAGREEALNENLKLLRSEQEADRRKGRTGLELGGSAAVKKLIDACVAGDLPIDLSVAQTFARFGVTGRNAWRARMVDAEEPARKALLRLLSKSDVRDLIPELLSLSYAVNQEDQVASMASSLFLRHHAQLPSAKDSLNYVSQLLTRQLTKLRTAGDVEFPGNKEVWEIDPQGALQYRLASDAESEMERCRQLAKCLCRLSHPTEFESAEAAAVLLEFDYRRTQELSINDPVAELRKAFGVHSLESEKFILLTIESAAQHDLKGAWLRGLQQLGNMGSLGLSKGGYEALIRANDSGQLPLRYAAVEVLSKIESPAPFAGSARSLETAMEMLTIESRPLAAVIGTNEELREHTRQILQEVGYRTEGLVSGRDTLRWIEQPRAVELILFVDHVGDLSLGQLIQKIRAHRRGSGIPVALLVEEVRRDPFLISEQKGLIRSFVPPNAVGMLELLKQCERGSYRMNVQSSDRALWKAQGQNFVRKLYGSKEYGASFSLPRWKEFVESHLGETRIEDASLDTLVDLGTRESQREIGTRMMNPELSVRSRREAAHGMIRTLKKHGNRLTIEEVQSHYDTYNRQGRQDLEARDYLGAVLDTFESLRP